MDQEKRLNKDDRKKGFTLDQLEKDGFDLCRRVDGIYAIKTQEIGGINLTEIYKQDPKTKLFEYHG